MDVRPFTGGEFLESLRGPREVWMFQMLHPGFFDPLVNDPMGPTLIMGGLIMEAIGFFMIWRIAQIKV